MGSPLVGWLEGSLDSIMQATVKDHKLSPGYCTFLKDGQQVRENERYVDSLYL